MKRSGFFTLLMAVILALMAIAPGASLAQESGALPSVEIDTSGLPAWAADPEISLVEEAPLDDQTPPGDEWPAHVLISFPKYAETLGMDADSVFTPQIQIFSTSKFKTYQWDSELEKLVKLTESQSVFLVTPSAPKQGPSTENFDPALRRSPSVPELPLLPLIPAAQVIHSNAVFLNFGFPASPTPPFSGVIGISYLTAYRQDVGELTRDMMFYSYQGYAAYDRAYYVSATFPVIVDFLPKEDKSSFTDAASYEKYMAEVLDKLDHADLKTAFTPSPRDLDALVSRLIIKSAGQ